MSIKYEPGLFNLFGDVKPLKAPAATTIDVNTGNKIDDVSVYVVDYKRIDNTDTGSLIVTYGKYLEDGVTKGGLSDFAVIKANPTDGYLKIADKTEVFSEGDISAIGSLLSKDINDKIVHSIESKLINTDGFSDGWFPFESVWSDHVNKDMVADTVKDLISQGYTIKTEKIEDKKKGGKDIKITLTNSDVVSESTEVVDHPVLLDTIRSLGNIQNFEYTKDKDHKCGDIRISLSSKK